MRKIGSSLFLTLLLAAALLVTAAGCTTGGAQTTTAATSAATAADTTSAATSAATAAAPGASAKDTLVYAVEGDPGNDINTITTSGRYDLTVERMLYSPLLNFYGPDDIVYELATGYDFTDGGKTVAFTLRDDVKWSDGEPFTADDVVFTFQKIIDTDYANGHENFIFGDDKAEVVKTGDYTVEFRFPLVLGNALEVASAEHFIMPKHIYDGDEALDNNAKNTTPVGTGPYKLAEYAEGQFVKFTANDLYFGDKPKINTVVFQIITDPNSASLALKTGEINALVIQPAGASGYGPESGLTIYTYPEDRVGYVSFNLGSERVQDINYRKAILFALNREELNTGVYLSKDYYVDAVSFLPYSSSFHTDDVEKYDFDLAKSGEYLSKVSGAQPVRIAYAVGNAATETQAVIIQQELKTAGVTAEVVAIETNSLFDKLEVGTDEFEMFLNGYIMGVDPSNYATLFVSGGPYNYARVADDELDGLFAAGSVETDDAKRLEIYQQAQRRLADLAVQFPIVTNLRLLAMTSDVGGVEDARFIPIYTFENFGKLYFK